MKKEPIQFVFFWEHLSFPKRIFLVSKMEIQEEKLQGPLSEHLIYYWEAIDLIPCMSASHRLIVRVSLEITCTQILNHLTWQLFVKDPGIKRPCNIRLAIVSYKDIITGNKQRHWRTRNNSILSYTLDSYPVFSESTERITYFLIRQIICFSDLFKLSSHLTLHII